MNKSIDVAAAVTVGIFASVLFSVALAVAPSLQLLDGTQYTLVKQAQIRVLQVSMTLISSTYTVLAIMILVRERRARSAPAFRLTAVALVLIVAALGYSVPTDIAYNQQILAWNPAAPPSDWAVTRQLWDASNALRTVPSIIAFVLQVIVVGVSARAE